MRVHLHGVDYRIRFEFKQKRHRQTTKALIEARVLRSHADGGTYTWEPVMTGEARCHPVDAKVYSRTRGKRIALDRAFLEAVLPDGTKSYHTSREDRAAFWAAFNAAHPVKQRGKKKKAPAASVAAPAAAQFPLPKLDEGEDDVL
jgi:hypothetical protein